MSTQVRPRDGGSSYAQSGTPTPRTGRGRHERPVSISGGTLTDGDGEDSLERIRLAHRALRDAHARVRAAGADSDGVSIAFAIARDSLNEASETVQEARKELILVHHEYEELNRRLGNQGRYPLTTAPVVLDAPGRDLCPDPDTARTAVEFMDALRTYRTWAGKPSYRAMASIIRNQCSQHYSSSTLQSALTGDDLPALLLVQAVITACGGSDAHQQMFTSAYRRLTMPQQGDVA